MPALAYLLLALVLAWVLVSYGRHLGAKWAVEVIAQQAFIIAKLEADISESEGNLESAHQLILNMAGVDTAQA